MHSTTVGRSRAGRGAVVLAVLALIVAAVPVAIALRAAAAAPGGGTFTGVTPYRVLDTRAGGQGPCLSGSRSVTIAGQGGVPVDAVAVALNVTAVDASVPGYLTVWPTGVARPTASSVNYVAGAAVPNNVQVKLGTSGQIDVFSSGGCPNVIIDIVGWFASGTPVAGGFTGVTPYRLLDTRGVQGPCIGGGRALQVAGVAGSNVPSNAAGVALNITVDNSTAGASGYLTVSPQGVPRPTASTLNYTPGKVVPNGAVVKVGTNGNVNLYTFGGCTHVIVDVVGWFTPGNPVQPQGFGGLTPFRVTDRSRGQVCPNANVSQVSTFDVQVAQAPGAGVPADALSVALNITVDAPLGPGFLTVWPTGVGQPTASSLNYGAGQTIANGVLVKLGSGGQVRIYSNAGCPRVIVDVVGVFVNNDQPPQTPNTPQWPNLSDPSVLTDGSTYYVFGSNTWVQGNPIRIPVRAVTDLTKTYPLTGVGSWDVATFDALSGKPAWTTSSPDYWAPTVHKFGSTYVMFFAARRSIGGQNDQCIGRATSGNPNGPFVPEASPFTCGMVFSTSPSGGGALDPEIVVAQNGDAYLFAAFGDTETPIGYIPLTASGTATTAPASIYPLVGKDFPWEAYFVENPSVAWDATRGDYLMAYSAGDWRTSGYATGMARCTYNPAAAPQYKWQCTKNPSKSPWLGNGNRRTGVGGLSFFPTTDGSQLKAVYASWTNDCEPIVNPWQQQCTTTNSSGLGTGTDSWRIGSVSTVDLSRPTSPAPLLK